MNIMHLDCMPDENFNEKLSNKSKDTKYDCLQQKKNEINMQPKKGVNTKMKKANYKKEDRKSFCCSSFVIPAPVQASAIHPSVIPASAVQASIIPAPAKQAPTVSTAATSIAKLEVTVNEL